MFDGCSMYRVACERAGIPVTKYFSSEIDPYAQKVSKANWNDIDYLGDVTQIIPKLDSLPKIDVVVGGSPCQGFSLAGKQLNFDDPRSKLFFEFVRIVDKVKPKYVLLENVRMKQESKDIITKYMDVGEPTLINSALLSAQNRNRLYWTNIPFYPPPDLGILLSHILEDADTDRDKSYCLDANYFKGGSISKYFNKRDRQLVFSFAENLNDGCHLVAEADVNGFDIIKRVYGRTGKSPALTTMQGGHREPKVICEKPVRVATINDGGQGNRIYSRDGKGITLTSQSGGKAGSGNMLVTSPIRDKSKTVRSGGRGSYDRHEWDSVDKLHWRKLTPLECERLQTLPDNYTNHVSNSQRYKMIGNGFTVDVIAHIIKGMAA